MNLAFINKTNSTTILFASNFLTSIVIILAICLGIIKNDASNEFNEYGWITTYSFVLLLFCGLINIYLYFSKKNPSKRWDSLIWLLMGVGFIFLALDEKFMIHENLDFLLHQMLNLKETPLTDRIDDVIIMLYGLIGLTAIIIYRTEFINYKLGIVFLMIGGALLVASGTLDVLTNDDSLLHYITNEQSKLEALHKAGAILEESTKLFSETTFIAAFISYFKYYKNN